MKRFAIAVFILGVGLWFTGSYAPTSKAESPTRERAVVEFAQTVKLLGVLLKGEYVIVHDEERMAQGEACTLSLQEQEWKGRRTRHFLPLRARGPGKSQRLHHAVLQQKHRV